MKYIRTKDGHIAKTIKYYEEDGIYIIERNGKPYFSVFEENVIQKADTIPELCDGIIVEEIGNESNWFVMGIDEFKNLEKEALKYLMKSWRHNLFIKNDKGLKYVARLNEEGEPELI